MQADYLPSEPPGRPFYVCLQLAGQNSEKNRVPTCVSNALPQGSGKSAVGTPLESPQIPFPFPTHRSQVSFSSLSWQPSLCWRTILGSQSPCSLCSWQDFLGINVFLEAWQPIPVSLRGESHAQRSLEGYSPWGRKELDATEAT